jgi:hypothetical protein
MIRNSKLLGLALVAFLAITAVIASSASAAEFTASDYPATISGTQSAAHRFEVGGGTVTCNTATFSGTQSGASVNQTIDPTYTGCTAFGFINSTVTGFKNTGGSCDYSFNANGVNTLVCPSGDVKIDAGPCSVTLEASKNTALKSNTYTNNTPSAGRITAHTAVTNIHAVVTSGFGCPVAGKTYIDAKYTGSTVLSGKNSGGSAVALTHDP